MGNILTQSFIIMCNQLSNASEVVEKSDGQFPFLAALILIAIIVIVSIGDMTVVDKEKEEKQSKDMDQKM